MTRKNSAPTPTAAAPSDRAALTAKSPAPRPARLAGLSGLQQFLETGFITCKKMGGADEFLQIIVGRETRAMERLLAGLAAPFAGLDKTS